MTSIAFITARSVLDRTVRVPDGFVFRYRHAIDALASIADVHTIARDGLTDSDLIGRLEAINPDLVIAPAYLGLAPLAVVTKQWRSLLLIEERVPSAQEWRLLPWRARVRAAAGLERLRCSFRPPVRAVIVNENERGWAQALLPRTPVDTVGLAVESDYWSERVAPATLPDSVVAVVVGSLNRDSNARDVAGAASSLSRVSLTNGPALALASASSPPQCVCEGIDRGEILWLGQVADVRPLYRAGRVVLVPSFVVPGTKSTILQAWAAGASVVTTVPAARSVGGSHGVSLLSGDTYDALAELVVHLASSQQLQESLVAAGQARLEAFDSDVIAVEWRDVVQRAMLDCQVSASWFGDTKARAFSPRKKLRSPMNTPQSENFLP